jgi:hypothetical protein
MLLGNKNRILGKGFCSHFISEALFMSPNEEPQQLELLIATMVCMWWENGDN